jgi:hypothetical protein
MLCYVLQRSRRRENVQPVALLRSVTYLSKPSATECMVLSTVGKFHFYLPPMMTEQV